MTSGGAGPSSSPTSPTSPTSSSPSSSSAPVGASPMAGDDPRDEALLAHFDSVLDSAVSSPSPVSTSPPSSRSSDNDDAVQPVHHNRWASSSSSSSRRASLHAFPQPASTVTPFSLLSEMFPNLPAHVIRAALTANEGDPSAAAAALAAPAPPDDAALARKLQDVELALADTDGGIEIAHPRDHRNMVYATHSSSSTPSRLSSNGSRVHEHPVSRFAIGDIDFDLEDTDVGTSRQHADDKKHHRRTSSAGHLPDHRDRSYDRSLLPSSYSYSSITINDDETNPNRMTSRGSDRTRARPRARNRSSSSSSSDVSRPYHHSVSTTQSSTPHTVVNRRRPHAPPTLTPTVRRDVLMALKQVIAPSLHAHFEEITFGDYEEVQPGYTVTLQNVAVSALSLTPESIMVRAVAGGFRVNVVNVFLELEIGQWLYHSHTFFGFKDSGRARVTANGLTASAMLFPRLTTTSDIGVSVGDVEVSIEGTFRLRTEGSSADWAYNAAAVLLKPLVISYVKEAVREVIFNALAAQLIGWTAWTSQPSRSCISDMSRNSSTVAPSASVTSLSSDFLAADAMERSHGDEDRIVPSTDNTASAR